MEANNMRLEFKRLRSLLFFIPPLLVLAITAAGAFINFRLIVRPIAEFLGGDWTFGNIGAAGLVLFGILLGVVITEARGGTRLFPFAAKLAEKKRFWVSLTAVALLVLLAGAEAYLGYQRNFLIHEAMTASGMTFPPPEMMANLASAGVGFILPLALSTTAYPFYMLANRLRGQPQDGEPAGS